MIDALANCILKIEHGIKSTTRTEDCVLGSKYLATLAPILAAAELRSNELKDLTSFEREVGQSCLIDPVPFGTFYEDWQEFRGQCECLVVSGMTANERLYALGLMDAFEQFTEMKEWEECRIILRRVYLDDNNINAIIEKHKKG